MENVQREKKVINLERTLGIILLLPPLVGAFLFLINLFIENPGSIPELRNLGMLWTGILDYGNASGTTTAAPIYLGLMAIAGAYLFKGTEKKQG